MNGTRLRSILNTKVLAQNLAFWTEDIHLTILGKYRSDNGRRGWNLLPGPQQNQQWAKHLSLRGTSSKWVRKGASPRAGFPTIFEAFWTWFWVLTLSCTSYPSCAWKNSSSSVHTEVVTSSCIMQTQWNLLHYIHEFIHFCHNPCSYSLFSKAGFSLLQLSFSGKKHIQLPYKQIGAGKSREGMSSRGKVIS